MRHYRRGFAERVKTDCGPATAAAGPPSCVRDPFVPVARIWPGTYQVRRVPVLSGSTTARRPRLADYRGVPDPELARARGVFVAEGRLVVRRLLGVAGSSPGP